MNWSALKTLWTAGRRGDLAAMVSIQSQVDIVARSLWEAVPDDRIDGSYDKIFEKMYDPEFPLRLLPPYAGSTDDEYEAFVNFLRKRLPEWVPSA